jgi:radical SAM protein with 4Fe4S-binding SPASM domain
MCWYHGENGVGDKYRSTELTLTELCGFVDQLSGMKPKIYFGGSEPFIRPDFLAILKHVKDHNLRVAFATNGTLLDREKIETLVDLGVDDVKFSIDGNKELHEHIRGKEIFTKVTLAVKELAEHRRKKAQKKPIITVNITITSDLVHDLPRTIQALKAATDNCADVYRLHHLWYVTNKELTTHQKTVKQMLGCSASGASCHLIPASSKISNPTALAEELLALQNCPKVDFFPRFSHDDIINFYTEGPAVKYRCSAPFSGAVVKPNGDVRFCPDEWIDDYVLGNIRKDNLIDIWNNEKARHFRKILWKQKHFAGCKRCSWMYSF